MNDPIYVLLVYDYPDPSESLRRTLKDLKIPTCSVRTCEEARRLISQSQPVLIFTATMLPDGTWVDVINMAEKAAVPPNVVVVSSGYDLDLHLSVTNRGAFDFLFPPFEDPVLDFVVQSATNELHQRIQTHLSSTVN